MIAIFVEFLKLGVTSFGGPTAHIGYFRARFVKRLGWLTEAEFAELLGLAQFLPGPASSQLGFAIGLRRGGVAGALAAFAGFTLPSAALMATAGIVAVGTAPEGALAGAIAGLQLVAVAVVAQALWGMQAALCPDAPRRALAFGAAALLIAAPISAVQIAVLALAAVLGTALPGRLDAIPQVSARPAGGDHATRPLTIALALVCLMLAALPVARPYLGAGALVFGGGHVVLPLLHEALPGIADRDFLGGYGLAQAMPGPLFTFASYLGGLTGGWTGAALATLAIFAPGFAVMTLALPLWSRLRRIARLRGAVAAVNAAVVGVLAAAWIGQILPHAWLGPRSAALAACLTLLAFATKLPPVALVALAALGGAALL